MERVFKTALIIVWYQLFKDNHKGNLHRNGAIKWCKKALVEKRQIIFKGGN
jgi:hypothetical protein